MRPQTATCSRSALRSIAVSDWSLSGPLRLPCTRQRRADMRSSPAAIERHRIYISYRSSPMMSAITNRLSSTMSLVKSSRRATTPSVTRRCGRQPNQSETRSTAVNLCHRGMKQLFGLGLGKVGNLRVLLEPRRAFGVRGVDSGHGWEAANVSHCLGSPVASPCLNHPIRCAAAPCVKVSPTATAAGSPFSRSRGSSRLRFCTK